MSIRLAPLYLVAALFAAFRAPRPRPVLPVAAKSLAFKDKALQISVKFPQTGNKAIDAVLADYARKSVAAFKTFESDAAGGDHPYELDMTYSIERNDGKMFAVLFTNYADTGGAHPNSDYAAFDFLLPDGAQVFLPEIVDGSRGIKRIAELVSADLLHRIGTGDDAASDKDTIAMGTAPAADNFRHFVWLPDRLHIFFPPYQVASYAAGPQESYIPLAKLKDVIRPDWRSPGAVLRLRQGGNNGREGDLRRRGARPSRPADGGGLPDRDAQCL